MASGKVKECSEIIAAKKLKIAFAESATAGWLTSEFSLVPQSGDILLGGIICYDACTKENLFGVTHEDIKKYTPESEEITRAITEGLKKYFKSDIYIGVTGLTASGGSESSEKPVGTMFIHFIINNIPYEHTEKFSGSPEEIIKQTIDRTADILIRILTLQDGTMPP